MVEYKEYNKEHINNHRWAKCQCLCGGKYTHHHKLAHDRSKKHQEYLKSIEQN